MSSRADDLLLAVDAKHATSRQRPHGRLCPLLFAAALALPGVTAAESLRNLSLEQALDLLKARGLEILYSSDLVHSEMRVAHEPRSKQARAILEEIVKPHGLTVRDGPDGMLLLVRAADSAAARQSLRAQDAEPKSALQELEEVVVSASHYRFVHDVAFTQTLISAADLQALPDLGDDPMRAAARLPGTASNVLSAKINVRGGEVDEALVRFDDLRLENPFHLKDFQSTFSTIGPGVVNDMRVYAGGFPVAFGDRMSSVIDIDPLMPEASRYTELALSFFNTSALTAGRTSDERSAWFVAGRRGNLDLLVDAVNSSIGRPRYLDFYGRFSHTPSESWNVSVNILQSDDSIVLFDGDHEEEAHAEYRDAYYWLKVGYQPSDGMVGNLLLARSKLDSERRGRADQEGIARGVLSDVRSFTMTSLQSDWSMQVAERSLLQLGGEWRRMRGRYDYSDAVEFDLLFDAPGAAQQTERARNASVLPEGDEFGAYANLRIEPLRSLTADIGVRWDRETLSADTSDQVSPRLSLMYSMQERTKLRASWGRYHQSQSITELQIADGITEYLAPQRADHVVASVEHEFDMGLSLRIEAYRKDYRRVRPRFENLLNTFVLLPELKPDRIRIAPERATAQGVELTIREELNGRFQWWLSYTWSSAEDVLQDSTVPRSWDQTHLFNGGLIWRSEHWELSAAATYHSGWPTTQLELIAAEPTPLVATGLRNASRLGNYFSVDMRIARTFEIDGAGRMIVFLEANNVLGRANDCCVEYEIENEEEGFGLDISRRKSLPATPSLGLIWRF